MDAFQSNTEETMTFLLLSILAVGQPAEPPPPKAPVPVGIADVEVRKRDRDDVLKVVPGGLAFMKKYENLGVQVLSEMKPSTAVELVKLFDSGAMDQWKDSRAVLEAVRRGGEPSGAWLVRNLDSMSVPENREAWVKFTLDICYDLKDIETEAAKIRASRKPAPVAPANSGEWDSRCTIFVLIVLGLLAAAFWGGRMSKSGSSALMHYPKSS
jgi:hypothetical protein